jgi:hypothetical protein
MLAVIGSDIYMHLVIEMTQVTLMSTVLRLRQVTWGQGDVTLFQKLCLL